jgi:hypothetical protein
VNLSPLIRRELRVALRKENPRQSRLKVTFWAAMFALMCLVPDLAELGYAALLLLGMHFAISGAVRMSVGLFSEERRGQTLELLFLTGMRPGELFLGKLLGGSLVAASDFLAFIPFFALACIWGAHPAELFATTMAFLPVLFLFAIGMSMLASVLCSDEGAALILAGTFMIAAGFFMPAVYLLGWAFTGQPPFSSSWLWTSPAYAAWLMATGSALRSASELWATIAGSAALAALSLILAGAILARTWRDDPDRRESWWMKWMRTWTRGGAWFQAPARDEILDWNAFQWLAQRDRRPIFLAWMVTLGVCLLWLLGGSIRPQLWDAPVSVFVGAILILSCIDYLELLAATRRIGEDRRNGMLEILLTTPLSPSQLIKGQIFALAAHFSPLRKTLFVLFMGMMVAGFFTRTGDYESVFSYVLIWVLLLAWCKGGVQRATRLAMWVALNSGRPIYSVFRTARLAGFVSTGPLWIALLLFLSWRTAPDSFPTGSPQELVTLMFFCAALLVLACLNQPTRSMAGRRLISEMRSVAQLPPPDSQDPRFKKWNELQHPLPPGNPIVERLLQYPRR